MRSTQAIRAHCRVEAQAALSLTAADSCELDELRKPRAPDLFDPLGPIRAILVAIRSQNSADRLRDPLRIAIDALFHWVLVRNPDAD
jgi:hypothetical protein